MSFLQILGMLVSVAGIVIVSVYSGTKKSTGENTNGAGITAGIIMGTLVGGSSTIGTAQLAYNFGMSAWWFTLGGGLACLVQTILFCHPLRESHQPTLIGIIRKEYGNTAGMSASVLNAIGTFINIISQLLAASAVVQVVWPLLGTPAAVVISAVFMVLYVVFGGTKGAGMVGILKLVLLYASMIICGLTAVRLFGGLPNIFESMRQYQEETGVNYFSLFARGAGKDIGAFLSLILGVLTTQTYAQAYITAKSDKAARLGGLISTLMIPPIGILGIIVGLYMRSITDPSVFAAKTALTEFVLQNMPGLTGGIALGTLFIASVGTGAGLSLGISSILVNDIIKKINPRLKEAYQDGVLSKVLIVVVLGGATLLSLGKLGDTILNFAFMSMGLRGSVVFLPLCFAIWAKGRIPGKYAVASIIISPVLVLIFGTILSGFLPFDSLFAGIIASAIIMGIGLFSGSSLSKMQK